MMIWIIARSKIAASSSSRYTPVPITQPQGANFRFDSTGPASISATGDGSLPGVSLAGSSQPGVTFTQARYSDSYSPAPGSSRGDGAWALGGYAPSRQDDGFQAARQYLGVSTAPPAGAMERPAVPILMQQPDGSQLQVPADLAQELLQRIMQFRGTSQ